MLLIFLSLWIPTHSVLSVDILLWDNIEMYIFVELCVWNHKWIVFVLLRMFIFYQGFYLFDNYAAVAECVIFEVFLCNFYFFCETSKRQIIYFDKIYYIWTFTYTFEQYIVLFCFLFKILKKNCNDMKWTTFFYIWTSWYERFFFN